MSENAILVTIDRSTIKKNPNAGRTTYMMSGPTEAKLEFVFEDGKANRDYFDWLTKMLKHSHTDSMSCREGVDMRVTTRLYDGDTDKAQREIRLVTKLPELPISVTTDTPQKEIYSMRPEPNYLFEYRPTVVECGNCGIRFSHEDLETDYTDYGPLENICPACNEVDCCVIEFESLPERTLQEITDGNNRARAAQRE